MKVRYFAIGLLLGIILATLFTALAQDNFAEIFECSKRDLARIFTTIQEDGYGEAIVELAEEKGELNKNNVLDFILKVDEYQNKWWTETERGFPRCTFAIQLRTKIGLFFDEYYIFGALVSNSLELLANGKLDEAEDIIALLDGHNALLSDLTDEIVDMIDDARDMIE